MDNIFIVVAFVVVALSAIRIVPPMGAYTVTRFGKRVRVLSEGFNVILPLGIEQVDLKLTLQVMESDSTVQIKTKDNAYVMMPAKVLYRIQRDQVMLAGYNLEDPENAITALVVKALKSACNSMTLGELFTDKGDIESGIRDEVSEYLLQNGFILDRVIVDEPLPSPEIQAASNKIVEASRLVEAAKDEAEAIRLKRVGEAQADAEAVKLRAKGFSDAREIVGESLGKSVKAARLALGQNAEVSDTQLLTFVEGVDYRDMLVSASKSGNTIIFGGEEARGLRSVLASTLAAQRQDANHGK